MIAQRFNIQKYFILVLILTSLAVPCSCLEITPEQAFEDADIVFSGLVRDIALGDSGTYFEATIDVDDLWKGEVSDEITVLTEIDSAACGFSFDIGYEYLVYAYSYDWGIYTNICTRTNLLDYSSEDLDFLSNQGECADGEINNDNPCNPMECWDGQWIEIIIDCAEQMGVPCEGGLYISPPDDVCCSDCVEYGDINQDGSVDVLDAIEVVGLVLYGEYNELVDMNFDGSVDILDVIEIIYLILN